MSDWIKREADRLKAAAAAEDKKRQWEIHKHRLVEQGWGRAWTAIIDALLHDVRDFNDQFTDRSERLEIEQNPTAVIITRHGQQTQVLRVAATEAGIRLHLIATDFSTQRQEARDLAALPFTATSDGAVGVPNNGGVLSADAVSERILKYLL